MVPKLFNLGTLTITLLKYRVLWTLGWSRKENEEEMNPIIWSWWMGLYRVRCTHPKETRPIHLYRTRAAQILALLPEYTPFSHRIKVHSHSPHTAPHRTAQHSTHQSNTPYKIHLISLSNTHSLTLNSYPLLLDSSRTVTVVAMPTNEDFQSMYSLSLISRYSVLWGESWMRSLNYSIGLHEGVRF